MLIHNVDILDNVDYQWFARQHLPDEDAVLLVSRRPTKRYLLFNSAMRLMGWINRETGEVRSPYPGIDPDACTRLAFSGIHFIDPAIFALMRDWPEKFSIVDFYLAVCRTHAVRAAVMPGLQLHDVGKLSELNVKLSS